MTVECDVLVAGGGPAGSTAAALLARRGWRVALVERERHPRFHIGESLLPMNLPVLERLGVLAQVEAIGVRKYGADFPAQNERGYNVFRFARALRGGPDHAFQVRRSEFDELLFRHAAQAGARTFEGVELRDVVLTADGVSASAGAQRYEARYLVDASGRDTLLGTQAGLKRRHPRHLSAALYAHFHGVERRPGEDAGNISIYRYAHGWVWVIPLRDGVTSIGAVCAPAHLKTRRGSREEFLLATLRGIPALAPRIAHATLAGNLQATGNYSYACTRIAGPRWIMAGDACAFVDPIFSSGVYLAMQGAERAAALVDAVLREPARERALQRGYARETWRGLGQLSWFIERFTTPAMAWLFANPRNSLRLEDAMISMLAGDVFDRGPVRWRLRAFRGLYLLASLAFWREQWRTARERRALRRAPGAGDVAGDPA